MSDLFLAETDLARASAGIADGEHHDRMSFATVALGAAFGVTDDSLEEGAAEDVRGAGKTRDEAIAIVDGGLCGLWRSCTCRQSDRLK